MTKGKPSARGERIVKALNQFAEDFEAGVSIESKYTVRTVRVIPEPSPPTGVSPCHRGSHRGKRR
jgi:hypothetical protein